MTEEAVICSGNGWTDVELYRGAFSGWPESMVDYLEPHTWMRWGDGTPGSGPSGALIGHDLMITNCHVGISVGYTVAFNFQVDETGEQQPEERIYEYEVVEAIGDRLTCIENRGYWGDYMLYRLAGSPGSVHGWNTLSLRTPVVGEVMAVIGHPSGEPKKFQPGHVVDVLTQQLRYDADTKGNNSGSPALDAFGFQVGVHTGGGGDPPDCHNNAVRINRIVNLNGLMPERARAALSTIVPVWNAIL